MSKFLVPLILCGALGASAAEIQQYSTRLVLADDGSAQATASVALSGKPAESVEIPVALKASGFHLQSGPPGLQLETCAGGVRATLPAGGALRFTFSFDAAGILMPEQVEEGHKPAYPSSSRLVRHAFVNTGATPILDYSLEAALPPDYRFQAIKQQSPKMGETEVEPRVRLDKVEGRQTARLHATSLKQGGSAAMLLEAVPTRRSPLWLAASVLAIILYLFSFRDLVAARP